MIIFFFKKKIDRILDKILYKIEYQNYNRGKN